MSETASLQRNKRSRTAHRTSASKTIGKVEAELHSSEPDIQRLKHYQQTLKQKAEVLDVINEAILESVEEDELEAEIDGIDAVKERIGLCLVAIQDALMPAATGTASPPGTKSDTSSADPASIRTSGTTSSAPDHTAVTPTTRMDTTAAGPRAPRIKLPKLTIQKFDGKVTSWLPFWNQFESAIHNNPQLNDVEKFNYLHSYLEDKAADAIRGTALTAANYAAAIAKLQRRFGDSQLIVDRHMDALLNLPAVKSHHDLEGLRRLVDTVECNIAGLKALGEKEESYGGVVTSVVMGRLPPEIRLTVARELGPDTKHANQLLAAIDKEIATRERYSEPVRHRERSPTPSKKPHPTAAAFLANANSEHHCPFCGQDHQPEACTKVTSPTDRANILKRQGRCFNCLKKHHILKNCRAPGKCNKCKGKHHLALCRAGEAGGQSNSREHEGGSRQRQQERPQGGSNRSEGTPGTPKPESQASTRNLYAGSNSQVLLQTAVLKVHNPDSRGPSKKIRAIMDSGSQRSYLTEAVARDLKLAPKKTQSLRIKTFGDAAEINQTCQVVDLSIQTSYNASLNIELLVVPSICDSLCHQPTTQAKKDHPHLRGLKLADPNTMDDQLPIDLLIGSDTYWSFVTGNVKRGKSGPTAIQTKVGWVLSGPTEVQEPTTETSLMITTTHFLKVHSTTVEESLDVQISKFWDLETLGIHTQEQSVQENFLQKIQFTEGRYQVSLPWKPTHRPLPTNLELATRRLQTLLKKLRGKPDLLREYDNIIKTQMEMGIVERVPENDSHLRDKIHYIPHQAVIRTDKATTKVRVVYDASAKTLHHPALNDCLYTGPSFEQSIFDILIRFRVHRVAMAADIEKAFLMVSMDPADRDVLRFLWTPNPQEETPAIQHLRFSRVVFGVRCSPYLLNATIAHHIQKYQKDDPAFVKSFLSAIYVDDVSFGAPNDHLAHQLFMKAKLRLAEAGFNLRKFTSNSSHLQAQIDSQAAAPEATPATAEEDLTFAQVTLGAKGEGKERREEGVKVLGVKWNPRSDHLVFGMEEMGEQMSDKTPTKREVVGAAARIFDPLGVLSPVTILYKILFQKLCKAGLGWDDPLDGECLREWKRLTAAMKEQVTFPLPRWYGADNNQKTQLVGFCDASTRAYAAVVYLRIGGEDAEARVRFLASKTRVAPNDNTRLTIPRLELLSALLLAKLCNSIENALEGSLTLLETICYSDAKVALYWIAGQDSEWKQFVENRVVEIRKLVPASRWRHCPGESNPADVPSRGMTPEELQKSRMWLEGPEWLKHHMRPASEKTGDIPAECLAEKKKTAHTLTTNSTEMGNLSQIIPAEKFSTLQRLLRVTAAVIEFTLLTRHKKLSKVELIEEARKKWIKEAQRELNPSKSLQRQLRLAQNADGLWRCVGRLANSNLGLGEREPFLLERNHPFTRLVVLDAHRRVLHGGVKATLTELRTSMWILKGRQQVKKLIRKCPICRRHEGKPFKSLQAPALPAFRVQRTRPFLSVGIDFAGPLFVKGQEEPKTWICLYTCASTRAVHLDLLQNLSTNSFLRSFRRFCARRGTPSLVVSDNAQTFKAANRDLQELLKGPEVQQHWEGLSLKWRFNVEKAPWQGGIFERMIRAAKRCLRKSIGKQSLTFDELRTLVVEVEAVLNSRPMSYLSSDDADEPLTPSHLMTGHRVLSLPDPAMVVEDEDPDYQPTRGELTRRMVHLKKTLDNFWRRWQLEYLQELREQHRALNSTPGVARPIQEGEPVIIYDENQPRGLWRLGRVTGLISSADGQVRAARVKVSSATGRLNTLQRPIQQLYPLEARDQSQPRDQDSSKEPPQDLTAEARETSQNEADSLQRDEAAIDSHSQPKRPSRKTAQEARERVQELAAQNLI